jgi:hypothetical protein
VHPGLHERAARLEDAHGHLEALASRHGVVDDVDATRIGHRHLVVAAQHAARPLGDLLDELRQRLVLEHARGAELLGELALRVEARDHTDLDVGVQRAQDRDRAATERAGAVHERPAVMCRRMTRDGVQRHRERVGEDANLVRHRVGNLEQHRVVRRHEVRVATGQVLRRADVDAGRERAVGEVPAQRQVADLARGAERRDAAGRARQPRVQHDAVAHGEASGLGADLHHVGHDLVAEHLRERGEVDHRVVGVDLAPVHEHLLRVRPADPGEAGPGDHPVGTGRRRLVDLEQAHRRVGQGLEQRVARRRLGGGFGFDAVDECAHGRPSST